MAMTRQERVSRILDRVGASESERELYSRVYQHLQDWELEQLERRLDAAVGMAPAVSQAVDELLARIRGG